MDQNQTGDSPTTTTLPAITPVPRLQQRRDGWAPAVQQAFIEALADTGSVEAACRFVDKSPASAYRLRRHPEGGEFAHAWQVAVDLGIQQIEDSAMDRARNGVEVPVFAYGDRIATRRVHNDQLVMFMLRNRAPDRYCADGARGMSAIDNRRLKRLKEAWREEWAEERRQKEPDIEQVRQEILRKVQAIKNADRQRWTPREWELHYALKAEREKRERREQQEARREFIEQQNPHVRAQLEAQDAAAAASRNAGAEEDDDYGETIDYD